MPAQPLPETEDPVGNQRGEPSCQTFSEFTMVADIVTPETVVV
jgi:hypothetical protein